jgi:glycosyltransferase involved in cell wall biosynthesis
MTCRRPLALTVIMPNFNHGRFLRQSLSALLTQSRSAEEIIVIDDASMDDSVTTISSMLSGHANARLICNSTNVGPITNLNRAAKMAHGDVILFAAADDIVYPTLFEKGLALLESYDEAAFFSARSDTMDEHGTLHGIMPTPLPLAAPGFVSPALAARVLMQDDGWFMNNTALFRRELLLAIGAFPEEFSAFTDGYVARVLALKHGACFSPEVLGAWRRIAGGLAWSQADNLKRTRNLLALIKRRMEEADNIFPEGYPKRWESRSLFGIRRFALVQSCQKWAVRNPALRLPLAILKGVITLWWFFTLRPWDIPRAVQRRISSLLTRNPQLAETP